MSIINELHEATCAGRDPKWGAPGHEGPCTCADEPEHTAPTSADQPFARVPLALIERARDAKWSENLELLDDTVDEIVESIGWPREDAAADTNDLRARHQRLTLAFPDQGYDWRTPITELVNEIPAMADEIDRLRGQLAKSPVTVDSVEGLKALPVGTIIRSLRPTTLVDVWFVGSDVTDDTEYRYMGVGPTDYRTSRVLLDYHGPFEVIWSSPAA